MEEQIIQNMIAQLGQSQGDRNAAALAAKYAQVDERSTRDLLLFCKKLAPFVNYYRGNIAAPDGDWSSFFDFDETSVDALIANDTGTVKPHLALLLSFLEQYKKPRGLINDITTRHLDFYYQRVLRLQKHTAQPDKTHLLIELKKNSEPIAVTTDLHFSAGKDAKGVELIYAPTAETVINTGSVASLRSLYVDAAGNNVRYAPVANSLDGLGKPLLGDEPKWSAFGYSQLPLTEIGFALSSPVLRLSEGARKISVALTVSGADSTQLNTAKLAGVFQAFLSGAKTWIGPYTVSPQLNFNVLTFDITLPASEQSVVDYDAVIHGYRYAADAPVLQLLLKADAVPNSGKAGYSNFAGVLLDSAKISVEVTNMSALQLDSDGGALDPKKAFMPFGAQAGAGARFHIGCDEALRKKLSSLTLILQWKDAPANFATHYADYNIAGMGNAYFTASATFRDGGSWLNNTHVALFDNANATYQHTLSFAPGAGSTNHASGTGRQVHALARAGGVWSHRLVDGILLQHPVYRAFRDSSAEVVPGAITLTLDKSFLHTEYRKILTENIVAQKKRADNVTPLIPNEPYTPTLQALQLSYRAASDQVSIGSTALNDFANDDVRFFHIGYFGQMREHGYQRAQFDFVARKSVALLPEIPHRGELLIGIADIGAHDSISLLFQVAEGSANPERLPASVEWSVLCDNYWRTLTTREVVRDTTNYLLASGLIQFVIPAGATTSNTLLPDNLLWLRAGINGEVDAVCQLIDVQANAIEACFLDQGNDPAHLLQPLPAKAIAKIKTPVAAIKSVKQPYASFRGEPAEIDTAFRTRVSERLRHKDRCQSAWDYERIVLQNFPGVYKVKCIPHAKDSSSGPQWLAPGHVLLVVVPDLRNRNAIDPLRPRVDTDTIARIGAFVRARAGLHLPVSERIAVKNPSYQTLRLNFMVQFRAGYEFNYYSEQLNRALIAALSPWAFDAAQSLNTKGDIGFGGKIYKSVLLDLVEELPYVDYVTDFKLFSYTGNPNNPGDDVDVVQPLTPDAILVSASQHAIAPVS